jgi:hypothetical protein
MSILERKGQIWIQYSDSTLKNICSIFVILDSRFVNAEFCHHKTFVLYDEIERRTGTIAKLSEYIHGPIENWSFLSFLIRFLHEK